MNTERDSAAAGTPAELATALNGHAEHYDTIADRDDARTYLLDATERYATLLARPHQLGWPTEPANWPDPGGPELARQLHDARDTVHTALETDWAEDEHDPDAWRARQRAQHLLEHRDPDRHTDAPGLAAAQEIADAAGPIQVAARNGQPTGSLAEAIARTLAQPGRRDALAALTETGWSEIRTQLTAVSDRTWRTVSPLVDPLRKEHRRQQRADSDPWNTPIPADARQAARAVQKHLSAGWRHADLDHFDRHGDQTNDIVFDPILTDGTRLSSTTPAEINSPQRIQIWLTRCRITNIDPDLLKGRNLNRLVALIDAASIDVDDAPEEAETRDWIRKYCDGRVATEAINDAHQAHQPYLCEDKHGRRLLHLHPGDFLTHLNSRRGIRIDDAELQRRLRHVGGHRPQHGIKRPHRDGSRHNARYWLFPHQPDDDDGGDDGSPS